MARRRLKKKFKKKINRAVRRFSAFTMALILMTVLLSLESFSSHAEEFDDALTDTLTVVELGETEGAVTEEAADVISDGTEGGEGESGDVIEDESGDVIEGESEEIGEEVSEEVSEEISEELSEDVSEEIGEDESEELSEDVSEKNSEEVSEKTSEKDKEKKAKDEKKKVKESKTKKKNENITYEVGDTIKFGQYEQDGNYDNGPEDIEWVILSIDEEYVLAISKYALDCQPYNTELTDVTWETCSLRTWLNNDFLNEAFSEEEQESIPEVTITNEDNRSFGTPGGNDTDDRIFCLSLREIDSYFGGYDWYNNEVQYGYNQSLICVPTQYAIDKGIYMQTITESDYDGDLKDKGYTSDVIGSYGAWWWLRSCGYLNSDACSVNCFGDTGSVYITDVNYGGYAVRPALYINSKSKILNKKTTKETEKLLAQDEELVGAPIAIGEVEEIIDAPVSEDENSEIADDEIENIETKDDEIVDIETENGEIDDATIVDTEDKKENECNDSEDALFIDVESVIDGEDDGKQDAADGDDDFKPEDIDFKEETDERISLADEQ